MISWFLDGSKLDLVLHVLSVLIATVLAGISFYSYFKDRRRKILFISIAFLLFAIKESFVFWQVMGNNSALVEFIAHLLNIIILILLFCGVTL